MTLRIVFVLCGLLSSRREDEVLTTEILGLFSRQCDATGMSLGRRLSLSQRTAKEALKALNMSPQFVPMMIREKKY